MHYRTVLKSAMKKARQVIAEASDREAATAALNHAKQTLHRSATRNLIKRQNASRRISRLSVAFNKAFNAPAETDSAPAEAAE